MAEWLVSVFSAVFIVSILSVLLPEGKLNKFVKPLISLVVIIIIITPFVNADGNVVDFTEISDAGVKIDSDFLEYVTCSKIDSYTKKCIKIAEKNGINGSEILIEYSVADNFAIKISSVSVNLEKAVISSDEAHIVILQRLSDDIGNYLGIDTSRVKIYE